MTTYERCLAITDQEINLLNLASREYRSSSKQANRRGNKEEAERLMNRSLELFCPARKLKGESISDI